MRASDVIAAAALGLAVYAFWRAMQAARRSPQLIRIGPPAGFEWDHDLQGYVKRDAAGEVEEIYT